MVLEIQVKRSLRFTSSDTRFGSVVAQIARASQRPGFSDRRHELAVAVGRATHNIQGPYQDVLALARQLGSADTFWSRIERPHSANSDMRSFVSAFKMHLEHADATRDGGTVWQMLSRFQILHFDFTAQGSAYEAWEKERAANALHPDDAGKGDALRRNLVELAIEAATSGGDYNRNELVQHLRDSGFRLAGGHRYASVRDALAEDARHALEDIADRVGRVRLTRDKHISAIRTALDQGHYVEIRGDAGVGKSGLLKRFAEEFSSQSRIIVLSAGRVRSGGWGAMRAALSFDGTARELLVDLASTGGAALFIDGLDSLAQDERQTVADLVREAARIPEVAIIATARRGLGSNVEEQEWLPADALDRIGRAAPVVIGELGKPEIAELRDAAPNLAPLLADNHPAGAVVRNLFRLKRLARMSERDRNVRTEIDMAKDWWQTADGKVEGHRERSRILRALAKQALSGTTLVVDAYAATPLDTLVGSGTLRDLGSDRMAFRHDILRDWAIANLLFNEPDIVERLPLTRAAPAYLVRGFELAARMKLECAENDTNWRFLLDAVSRDGTHDSWRRAVLLAVVRSESGIKLLSRVKETILADEARLLLDLIRTVKAVEVRPLSEHPALFKITLPEASAGLFLPSDPSWTRLVLWLLALGEDLPEAATADVASFFAASPAAIFGLHDVGNLLAHWFYLRLVSIEAHRSDSLAFKLRSGFLVICNHSPSLAAHYIRSLKRCHWRDEAVQTVMKLSSVVARVVPNDLADLTLSILIPWRQERKPRPPSDLPASLGELPSNGSESFVQEGMGSGGLGFGPPSPEQGPFLALLRYAPEIGLKLVRQLVDHALLVRSRRGRHGADAMTVTFPDGGRVFSSMETYMWSREYGNVDSCVQSALMALEAWAHHRIEEGEEVEAVLADVVPTAGGPAAYLLVAVDLVLSHRPESLKAASPFLSCPELLCLDLERMSADKVTRLDSLGLDRLFQPTDDPPGTDRLKARPSRHCSLESLLGAIANSGPPQMRIKIAGLLQQAIKRLGPYSADADKFDPEFMAAQALNALDPANWRELSTIGADGKPVRAWEYVSPPKEAEHLERLRTSASPSLADRSMQSALLAAVEDPSRSSSEFAHRAMDWVLGPPLTVDLAGDEARRRAQATIAAAVITMRDGDDVLRNRHQVWARTVFLEALHTDAEGLFPSSNIQFNPVAMAFIGIVHLLRRNVEPADVRALLEAASRQDLLAASGFRVAADSLAAMDERLPRAVLRTAFASCICTRRRRGYPRESPLAGSDQRVQDVIEGELGWLYGEFKEPEWPTLPMASPRRAKSLRIQPIAKELSEDVGLVEARVQTDKYFDDPRAATWLSSASGLFDVKSRLWLRDLAQAYAEWTAISNGARLNPQDHIEVTSSEWNAAYFNLVAHCLPGLATKSIDRLALEPIRSFPDESFFDAASHFLRSMDSVYFGSGGFPESDAVRIRASLAERLSGSYCWTSRSRDPSTSIEVRLGSAVAALFFNNWHWMPPSSCYLLPRGVGQVGPFLPVLERLVVDGTGGFVASMVLDLLEVSPRAEHLSFIATAAEAWLKEHPHSTKFWVDTGTARRLCGVIDSIGTQQPFPCWDLSLRNRVGNIVSGLVRLGVPQAGQIEQALADSASA